jgi:hypothetical protein
MRLQEEAAHIAAQVAGMKDAGSEDVLEAKRCVAEKSAEHDATRMCAAAAASSLLNSIRGSLCRWHPQHGTPASDSCSGHCRRACPGTCRGGAPCSDRLVAASPAKPGMRFARRPTPLSHQTELFTCRDGVQEQRALRVQLEAAFGILVQHQVRLRCPGTDTSYGCTAGLPLQLQLQLQHAAG